MDLLVLILLLLLHWDIKMEKYWFFDILTMVEITNISLGSPMKQFSIHRHHPFGLALTNNLISFSFETSILETELQIPNIHPDSFWYHQSEATCAKRVGNSISCLMIKC
jgi:hypothetical protein